MDIRLNHQLMLAQQPPSVVPTNLQQAEQHVVKAELKITGIKELQKVYEGAEPQEAFREQLKQAKEELQNATEQVEQMQPQESVMKADDAKDEVEEEELEQEEELALASEVVEDEKAEHEEEEDDDDEYLEVIGINKKTGEPVLHALDIHNAPKKEPPKPEKAPDNAVSNVQKKKM
jgi:lysyl-tRNA synthetase class I